MTAYDMAVKADYNSIMMLFNAHKGKMMVNKMVRPRGHTEKMDYAKHISESDSDETVDTF